MYEYEFQMNRFSGVIDLPAQKHTKCKSNSEGIRFST